MTMVPNATVVPGKCKSCGANTTFPAKKSDYRSITGVCSTCYNLSEPFFAPCGHCEKPTSFTSLANKAKKNHQCPTCRAKHYSRSFKPKSPRHRPYRVCPWSGKREYF